MVARQAVYIGKQVVGRDIYAVHSRPGCLSSPPWGAAEIECVVFNCKERLEPQEVDEIAKELVFARTEHVTTTGRRAELLHDAIDQMSVRLGRQQAVGDGRPMTAWFEELVTVDEMARETVECLWGNADYVVALIVGDDDDFRRAVDALKRQLSMALREHDEEE